MAVDHSIEARSCKFRPLMRACGKSYESRSRRTGLTYIAIRSSIQLLPRSFNARGFFRLLGMGVPRLRQRRSLGRSSLLGRDLAAEMGRRSLVIASSFLTSRALETAIFISSVLPDAMIRCQEVIFECDDRLHTLLESSLTGPEVQIRAQIRGSKTRLRSHRRLHPGVSS
jgi:hypothetical protein